MYFGTVDVLTGVVLVAEGSVEPRGLLSWIA